MGTILGADGQEVGSQGPWWAKSLWVVGPITVIALGLVYLLAVDVRNEARAATQSSIAVQRDLAEHQRHTEQLHRNIEDYMRVQNLLTRQLCVNAAKNPNERAECFKP